MHRKAVQEEAGDVAWPKPEEVAPRQRRWRRYSRPTLGASQFLPEPPLILHSCGRPPKVTRATSTQCLTHVDPFCAGDRRHPKRIDLDRAVRRTATGHNNIEALLAGRRNRSAMVTPIQRTHATGHMTRQNSGHLCRHKAQLAIEQCLGLVVVHPCIAAGYQQDMPIGDP
jgi:hypothetical protein